MKKLLMALVFLGFALVGCAPSETPQEHSRRLLLTSDLQLRAAVDDWDYFWLMERNCRLSRWNTRIGF